jgi:hypothetical protein
VPVRLLALPLALTALLATGCSGASDAVSGATDCAALASDIARSGLSGVPTAQEADQAVDRLDERIDGLQNAEVREAATALRDRLRELQEAVRSADVPAASQAASAARDAARDTAQACGLPAERFLG